MIIEALRKRFPDIKGPRTEDICYATQNRQDAVKKLVEKCDLVLVVGSKNSSNSNRLCELARRLGKIAYLIDDETDIDPGWISDPMTIGVTSGASAPEVLVKRAVDKLHQYGAIVHSDAEALRETVEFALPRELRIE